TCGKGVGNDRSGDQQAPEDAPGNVHGHEAAEKDGRSGQAGRHVWWRWRWSWRLGGRRSRRFAGSGRWWISRPSGSWRTIVQPAAWIRQIFKEMTAPPVVIPAKAGIQIEEI